MFKYDIKVEEKVIKNYASQCVDLSDATYNFLSQEKESLFLIQNYLHNAQNMVQCINDSNKKLALLLILKVWKLLLIFSSL